MDDFIHYLTDTEPGSSGSPVFNDQWIVVALHHSGVRDPKDRNNWIANEGVRISSILAHIYDIREKFDSKAKSMINVILEIEEIVPIPEDVIVEVIEDEVPTPKVVDVGKLDKIWYEKFPGYDPSFLGVDVLLPSLEKSMQKDIASTDKKKKVLDYINFSIVMSKSRRMAFYTAVNIDGKEHVKIKRTSDKWYFDPRIDKSFQCGNDLYVNNKLDRGHLVRRLDPNWGEDADKANEATFHFTNCTPQHENLNQKIWVNLEDYILNAAKNINSRLQSLQVQYLVQAICSIEESRFQLSSGR